MFTHDLSVRFKVPGQPRLNLHTTMSEQSLIIFRANAHAAVTPSQGRNSTSALESDFHSLKAELDELAAGLHKPEQRCSTAQAQLNTFPASHAVFHDGPFTSSKQRWCPTLDHMPDDCNELLQRDELHHGSAPAQQNVDDIYQQHDRHTPSDRTAQDAQQYNHRESSHTDDRTGGQGYKSGSRSRSPRVRSVLGCSSVRSLPVLNNSFIVPAQAVKPKKVDRVTRYR